MICAGAATNWAFPAILSGTYYPSAYDGSGGVRSDLESLPDILSEAGYATAGFVACNPYVSKWSDRFDTFWNATLSPDSPEWYSSSLKKWASRIRRTALMQKRVSAASIAERAVEWYEQQERPRFLWMHVMEPHLPYYPGLQKARQIGLIDSYRSVLSYQRNGDATPSKHIATRKELYNKCVELLDEHMPSLLDFLDDDAMILAFGDHGEEFEHGHYDHERLYDECMRVPLYHKNAPESLDQTVRQIDIGPTILDALGLDIPDRWAGRKPAPLSEQPAYMLTPEPGTNLLHAGIRTNNEKFIKSFDQDSGELEQTEYYNLESDPHERDNLADEISSTELEEKIDNFVSEHEPALKMSAATGLDSTVVESRLEDLGYK
jgi:arylsulfatase A-like enzyme